MFYWLKTFKKKWLITVLSFLLFGVLYQIFSSRKFALFTFKTDYLHGKNKVLAIVSDHELSNKTSPYFGITFVNSYGTSSINRIVVPDDWFHQFTHDLPPWTTYMPHVMPSIEKYKQENPNQNRLLFTSSKSCVTVTKQKQFVVGQTFVAHIQARNSLNQNKQFGGDYFRAVLINNSTSHVDFRDGISCDVEDHFNGTYTLNAPILVPGTYKLEVLLCASVELVSTYVDWANGRTHFGFIFTAQLESNEVVECNIDLLLYDDYKNKKLCNYSNPRNGEPFFCTSPPSGNCSRIINIGPKYIPNYGFQKPFDNVPKMQSWFFKDQPIKGSGLLFEVTSELKQDRLNSKETNNIRQRPNGYVYNSQWVSLMYNYKHKSLEDFKECFLNKTVFFLGDSTARQFFLLFQKPLELTVATSLPAHYHHILRAGHNEKLHISIYYRSHGPPFRLQGSPTITPYISDIIDNLKTGGPNMAVVISIGLHYLEFHPAFYIHRLLGIKRAILKHNKRYSSTTFIIKGINISTESKYPFEWLVLRYNVLLKNLFSDIENVAFIDLWDMTTVWPISTYHPDDKILVDQVNLMFKDVCS